MDRTGIWAASAASLALLLAGCAGSGTQYVDEQGRRLQTDSRGRPIMPGGGGAVAPQPLPIGPSPIPTPTGARPMQTPPPIATGSFEDPLMPPPSASGSPDDAFAGVPSATGSPDDAFAGVPSATGSPDDAFAGVPNSPTRRKVPPAKKIDASSELDKPPAGS